MTYYVVTEWMLIALVILPFLFGMLFGMRIYEQRAVLNRIKKMPIEQLEKLILEREEDARE